LAADSAVTELVTEEGSVITVAGPESGVEYRLTFPEGAVVTDVEVTVTPISGYEGFPFSGGLVGGVQLEPTGLWFLKPVTVEIALGVDQVAELRQIINAGRTVYGFSYVGEGEELAATRVEVADDLTVIRLETFGFSGHGAGAGTLDELLNLAPSSDAARAAQQEISRIIAEDTARWLNDPNHDDDYFGPIENPTVRADISQEMSNWYNDPVLPLTADAILDSSKFEDALNAAIEWQAAAIRFEFLSEAWGVPTDEFAPEGQALKTNLTLALLQALSDANAACRASGDITDLARVMDLDRAGARVQLMDSQLSTILTPGGFCLNLEIKVGSVPGVPGEFVEGMSDTLSFTVESQAGFVPTDDLVAIGAGARFTPRDPNLLSVQPHQITAAYGMNGFETEVTAGVPGNGSAQTELDLELTVHGFTLATDTIIIDIEPAVTVITCSGDPATIVDSVDVSLDLIWVTFDGVANCEVRGESNPDMTHDDFPDSVAVALDVDTRDMFWDDEGAGTNWSRDLSGSDQTPGTHAFEVVHAGSGLTYTMVFTVEVTRDTGRQANRMTVSDVSFTLLSRGP
jgi:hypothetical protein